MPFAHTLLSDVELSSSSVALTVIILRYAVLQRGEVYDSGATYIPSNKINLNLMFKFGILPTSSLAVMMHTYMYMYSVYHEGLQYM